MCGDFLLPAFFCYSLYLHFYYLCIIVRKCQPVCVSMCPLRMSSWILVPSPWRPASPRQRWQAWPFVSHQYAWRPAPRRVLANQHVSLQVFPSLSSLVLQATYCINQGCGRPAWPRVSFPLLSGLYDFSLSIVVLCQGKFSCSPNDVSKYGRVLGRIYWFFCSLNKPQRR